MCSLLPCNPVFVESNPPFLLYNDADSRAIVNFSFVFFSVRWPWEKGNFVSISETKGPRDFETHIPVCLRADFVVLGGSKNRHDEGCDNGNGFHSLIVGLVTFRL